MDGWMDDGSKKKKDTYNEYMWDNWGSLNRVYMLNDIKSTVHFLNVIVIL